MEISDEALRPSFTIPVPAWRPSAGSNLRCFHAVASRRLLLMPLLMPLLTTPGHLKHRGLLYHITSDAPGTLTISASPDDCGCACRHLCHVSHLLSSDCPRLSQYLHHSTSLATPVYHEYWNPERAGFSVCSLQTHAMQCTHNSCHDPSPSFTSKWICANSPNAWAPAPGDTYFPVCCMSLSLGLSPSCPSGLIW
jgi:hypothetical protein